MAGGLRFPSMATKLHPEEIARLFDRVRRHDSERQRHLDEASRELDGRTHVVWLLREGGVSMDRIVREVGHSRALLSKQLADFDPKTGRRVKPAVLDAEAS